MLLKQVFLPAASTYYSMRQQSIAIDLKNLTPAEARNEVS